MVVKILDYHHYLHISSSPWEMLFAESKSTIFNSLMPNLRVHNLYSIMVFFHYITASTCKLPIYTNESQWLLLPTRYIFFTVSCWNCSNCWNAYVESWSKNLCNHHRTKKSLQSYHKTRYSVNHTVVTLTFRYVV